MKIRQLSPLDAVASLKSTAAGMLILEQARKWLARSTHGVRLG